jgi:hypothetical protein
LEPFISEINWREIWDHSQYSGLISYIRNSNRFVLDQQYQLLVNKMVTFAKNHRTITIDKSTSLFRARIHPFDFEEIDDFDENKMLAPPPMKATEGRINPSGIPCLYISSDEATAIAECRPWIGASLTVVELKLKKETKVADFSDTSSNGFDNVNNFQYSWVDLFTYLFSMPVHIEDMSAYAPTQFIAETLKANGFDGIKYVSSQNKEGRNLAIFDCKSAYEINRRKADVKNIKYETTFRH